MQAIDRALNFTWKALPGGLFVMHNGADESVGVMIALLVLIDPVSELAADIRHPPSTVRHLVRVDPHCSAVVIRMMLY